MCDPRTERLGKLTYHVACGMVHRLDAEETRNVTRLAGKMALVTGGGTGIGQAIAVAFAREGARVAVAGRRKDKLEQTLRLIREAGSQALAIECDVSRAADAERAIQAAEDCFGSVNVLVNNAGTMSVSTVETIA